MEPFPRPDPGGTRRPFPTLPIVTPDPPRLSEREKYGGLFSLGVAGLVVLVGLIGWFAWGTWSLREVWRNVYVLHDQARTEEERVGAAHALGRSPDVNQRQLWDIALRTPLPPLARYVVAEGLTAEAVSADPKGYGLSVARSEGWPDWLRLILARPLAYAAAVGKPVPFESLVELGERPDPVLRLLANYAMGASTRQDPAAIALVRETTRNEANPLHELAGDLAVALDARRIEDKLLALDRATLRLRSVHPEVAGLWKGWEVQGGTLRRIP